MMSPIEAEPASVVLHLPAPAPGERLVGYLRGLLRPRALLVLAALVVTPRLLVEAALSDPGSTLRSFTTALGAGACLLVVLLGAVATAVQRVPASTITFGERGIRQETGGTVREHDWGWVIDFMDHEGALEILVQPPPMRSFQLARPEPQWLVVSRRSVEAETLARLQALLEVHVRRGGRGQA